METFKLISAQERKESLEVLATWKACQKNKNEPSDEVTIISYAFHSDVSFFHIQLLNYKNKCSILQTICKAFKILSVLISVAALCLSSVGAS